MMFVILELLVREKRYDLTLLWMHAVRAFWAQLKVWNSQTTRCENGRKPCGWGWVSAWRWWIDWCMVMRLMTHESWIMNHDGIPYVTVREKRISYGPPHVVGLLLFSLSTTLSLFPPIYTSLRWGYRCLII